MRQEMPAARQVTIDGAGHDVHLDAPDALAAWLDGFISGVLDG